MTTLPPMLPPTTSYLPGAKEAADYIAAALAAAEAALVYAKEQDDTIPQKIVDAIWYGFNETLHRALTYSAVVTYEKMIIYIYNLKLRYKIIIWGILILLYYVTIHRYLFIMKILNDNPDLLLMAF